MDSIIVEVALGLAAMFFLLATLGTAVNEVISRTVNMRSKALWATLDNVMSRGSGRDRSLGVDFMVRSLFSSLGKEWDHRPVLPTTRTAPDAGRADTSAPSDEPGHRSGLDDLASAASVALLDYKKLTTRQVRTKVSTIPGRVFASALLEIADGHLLEMVDERPQAGPAQLEAKVRAVATRYEGSPLARHLSSVAIELADDAEKYLDNVGAWFDAQMVILTQTYRRNTKWMLAIIGLATALLFNADALAVGATLVHNAEARQAASIVAGELTQEGIDSWCANPAPPSGATGTLTCTLATIGQLKDVGLVMPFTHGWWAGVRAGWQHDLVLHVLGLLVTTAALSLGGPFWFDAVKNVSGLKKAA